MLLLTGAGGAPLRGRERRPAALILRRDVGGTRTSGWEREARQDRNQRRGLRWSYAPPGLWLCSVCKGRQSWPDGSDYRFVLYGYRPGYERRDFSTTEEYVSFLWIPQEPKDALLEAAVMLEGLPLDDRQQALVNRLRELVQQPS